MSSEIRSTDLTHNEIIVAVKRGKRPDQFRQKHALTICPFCPGHEHMTPVPEIYRKPIHRSEPWTIRVIPNKFPAFEIEGANSEASFNQHHSSTILDAHGAHEVLVETPEHETDYSAFSAGTFELILEAIMLRTLDLYQDCRIRYIQVFKNFGDDAGASLRHEHTQIIGLPEVPLKLRNRLTMAENYRIAKGRSIFTTLVDYARTDNRLFHETEHFVCLVPYEAKFPCEIWVMPKHQCASFSISVHDHLPDLAHVLRVVYRKLKSAFGFMPPFNAFIEEAPQHKGRDCDRFFSWRYRITPRVTKIGGFEVATASYINPTPPEESARALREASF